MPYAEELLQLARSLVQQNRESQAALGRAMSTAYYALFHLLVSEACSNWSRVELRAELGRLFQHGRMKSASNELKAGKLFRYSTPPVYNDVIASVLTFIAGTFVEAQQKREEADYNTGKIWTEAEVLNQIEGVQDAFDAWGLVRTEDMAQEYLLSLLGRRQRQD